MRHGSLFSGIGGFDLAAEWVGWENVFQVENDEWCQKVLIKNFPNVKKYKDIKDFNGAEWRGRVNVISGGFPCQPFSQAGKRQGKADDRYLWPEMLRVISEAKPSFVVGENVAGLLSMENGRTLERILFDLENEGYQVEVFVIPACAVGAWHRRDRVWIVAWTNRFLSDTDSRRGRGKKGIRKNDLQRGKRKKQDNNIKQTDKRFTKDVPDTESKQSTSENVRKYSKQEQVESGRSCLQNGISENVSDTEGGGMEGSRPDRKQEPQAPIRQGLLRCNGSRDGRENWESEPDVGRVAHGIPDRVDCLKGLGNAIVPQIAFEIFQAINKTITK